MAAEVPPKVVNPPPFVVDRGLANRASTEPDVAKRKAIYAQVEQRLVDLAPWVFLHWRPQAEATRANIKGYTRLPGALGNKSTGGLKYLWKE